MNRLKELYYNPKTGFMSAQKLYLKLNKEIPLRQIKKFLEKQVHQLHKEFRNQPSYSKINVYSVNDQWQIDLVDLSKYSRWNASFKYLLCCIDVFSRKVFVIALKRKSHATEAIRQITTIQKPILIQSDNGTEFVNTEFRQLMKERGIRHITVAPGDHKRQGIIERFNRTLEKMISKYQESRKTNKYIDVLDDLVYNYNHTHHRTIDSLPERRFQTNPNSGTIKVTVYQNQIKVGDKVRVLKDKQTFKKGYETNYCKSLYNVISGNGYTFKLQNDKGETMMRTYKYYELLRVAEAHSYSINQQERELPLTNKKKRDNQELDELGPVIHKKRRLIGVQRNRNKRELEDLGPIILYKRRKISAETYFLV